MEKSYGSGFGVGESRKSGEKMKIKKDPEIFNGPNEREGARNQT